MNGSCRPSGPKREVWESFSHAARATSQRSGSSATSPIISSASAFSRPFGPSSSSVEIRHGTAHASPTASRVSVRTSSSRRTRFRGDPPYSSLRRLWTGERKKWRRLKQCAA